MAWVIKIIDIIGRGGEVFELIMDELSFVLFKKFFINGLII